MITLVGSKGVDAVMTTRTRSRIAWVVLALCWLSRPCAGLLRSGNASGSIAAVSSRVRSLQHTPASFATKRQRRHNLDKRYHDNGCPFRVYKGRLGMVVSPAELWDSYLGVLDAAPLLTKSITAGIIFPAADATAQIFDTNKKRYQAGHSDDDSSRAGWDWPRTLRWLFFGFAVQAPWNHFFYVLLDGALPPTPEPLSGTTAVKVLIDQFVQAPIFTIIIFGVLGLLEGKSMSNIREQLDNDYKSTMLANWAVFVPAAVVNLAFCPPQLRVLFLNVVFFAWTIYLSAVVSRGGEETIGES